MFVSAAVTHQSQSSDIIDVLTDLLDKAQAELDDNRQPVMNAAHKFAELEAVSRGPVGSEQQGLEPHPEHHR